MCTSWPLPPLHLCRFPDSGQSWVCDDSCHHPSWFKDRHSSQFYLILSASSGSSKIWLWALPPVFPPSLGSCPDTQVKTLVSFPPSSSYRNKNEPTAICGRVLYSLSGNHPQCPFVQMTDTEVTFLSCYNTVGHARVYVMALTSPPSLPLSRLWAELSVRRFMSSPLLIQGSSLLSVLPYSLSVFWNFKNLTLSVTTSLPAPAGILPGHTSQDPCLLSILIILPFL